MSHFWTCVSFWNKYGEYTSTPGGHRTAPFLLNVIPLTSQRLLNLDTIFFILKLCHMFLLCGEMWTRIGTKKHCVRTWHSAYSKCILHKIVLWAYYDAAFSNIYLVISNTLRTCVFEISVVQFKNHKKESVWRRKLPNLAKSVNFWNALGVAPVATFPKTNLIFE